jgi:radical SAM protein with 4Fe4S-binding SPASM domain
MCYFWGETGAYATVEARHRPEALELELIQRLVHELKPQKPIYSFFGGEPLMHPQIEDVIVTIKEAGSFVDTPTNGTHLKDHAAMLVQTGFDSIRVSLDGPREINDKQRGEGTFAKAMAGIEALYDEKQKAPGKGPTLDIIYTVTEENGHALDQFFLRELPLHAVDNVTIQMQNFITPEMGEGYGSLLASAFRIESDRYWRGMIRSPKDFDGMDPAEIARQVEEVKKRLTALGKDILLLPPAFSQENLSAYLSADWDNMTDRYRNCPAPWTVVDITASGDVAPCHVFYDLTMGNLHEKSFSEIWNGSAYQRFRSHMRAHRLMSICHGCCVLYLIGRSG